MYGNGIGQGKLIQFPEIIAHFALIKGNDHFFFHQINLGDLPNISIEDILVIIVFRLDDLVPDTKLPTKFFHIGLSFPRWVQSLLQGQIHFTHSKTSAIHGTQHLNIHHRIQRKLPWNALSDHGQHRRDDLLGLISLQKIKIFLSSFARQRHVSLIHPVGIGDDLTGGCLPENLLQPSHLNAAAGH